MKTLKRAMVKVSFQVKETIEVQYSQWRSSNLQHSWRSTKKWSSRWRWVMNAGCGTWGWDNYSLSPFIRLSFNDSDSLNKSWTSLWLQNITVSMAYLPPWAVSKRFVNTRRCAKRRRNSSQISFKDSTCKSRKKQRPRSTSALSCRKFQEVNSHMAMQCTNSVSFVTSRTNLWRTVSLLWN